jgi:hypothetical protein
MLLYIYKNEKPNPTLRASVLYFRKVEANSIGLVFNEELSKAST